jgi:uncharacterized protein YeaO (DUF488 family)
VLDVRSRCIHDPAAASDGLRLLVDRVSPRGISRAAAAIDEWCGEAAPSPGLRKSFGHDPARFAAFARAYASEGDQRPETVEHLRARARRGRLTLLFAAREREHNHARVLAAYLSGERVRAYEPTRRRIPPR